MSIKKFIFYASSILRLANKLQRVSRVNLVKLFSVDATAFFHARFIKRKLRIRQLCNNSLMIFLSDKNHKIMEIRGESFEYKMPTQVWKSFSELCPWCVSYKCSNFSLKLKIELIRPEIFSVLSPEKKW